MVGTPVSSSRRGVAALGCGFEGQILLPGDDGYDQARRVWNAIVDRRPAVIARCASTAGVAAAVRFGRDRKLEIGVRGGGCSWRCGSVGWCERGAAAWTAVTHLLPSGPWRDALRRWP